MGIGSICIVHFTYIFILSKKSKNWIIAEGEIISSKIQESYFDEGVMYRAIIHYKYTIGGKKYSSKRIFYGDYIGKNFSKSVRTLVNKYDKREKVLVYYNPHNPRRSVLETGVHPVIYRELFIGILFFAISVFMVMKESVLRSLFS